MSEWLVGVLKTEYRVEADTYWRAKSEAVRLYKEEHPDCPHGVGLLCLAARARKLDKLIGRVESLDVE